MSRLVYSCLFYLAMPLVLLRLLYRSVREPAYRDRPLERFGFFQSRDPGRVIWLHAVSAGETIAAVPLIKRLNALGYRCLVTNMTPTGRERARLLLGDSVENSYAPYDLPGSVARFLQRNRPLLMITIDTELWPNTMAACARLGVPTMLANGRLSMRSARGYERIAGLAKPMVAAINLFAVQTPEHAQRFIALGADPATVSVTGSIKFDGEVSADYSAQLDRARSMIGDRPVLLGASTHEGEEAALLALYPRVRGLLEGFLLVLVPRHTHRCDKVEQLCKAADLSVTQLSQYLVDAGSDGASTPVKTDVLLVDVMGELESFYPLARVAFVGGSLVPVGGHNLLEAVRAGTPVVMGHHLDNIDDIAALFSDAGGLAIASDTAGLHDQLLSLMVDADLSQAQVEAANAVLTANRGGLEKTVQLAVSLLRDLRADTEKSGIP